MIASVKFCELIHFLALATGEIAITYSALIDLRLDYRVDWRDAPRFSVSDGRLRVHDLTLLPVDPQSLPNTSARVGELSLDVEGLEVVSLDVPVDTADAEAVRRAPDVNLGRIVQRGRKRKSQELALATFDPGNSQGPEVEATMVESALTQIDILDRLDFQNFKIN